MRSRLFIFTFLVFVPFYIWKNRRGIVSNFPKVSQLMCNR